MRPVMGVVLAVLGLWAAPARAWNCSNPLAERVLVPSNTQGTFGDGDGQLAWYNGQLYECEVVTPSTPSNDPSSTSSSSSNSASNSGATSTSKATGGNSSATGGSVSGSGNSANTVTNTVTNTVDGGQGGSANQHQGQSQSQSTNSSASVSGVGNNSNNYSNVTNIPQQVESAIAPTILPTVPCFKGYSGAAQTTAFGFSFGAGKIDSGCDARETARSFAGIGNRTAAAKILCNQPASRKAGLTSDECLAIVTPQIAPTPVSAPPAPIVVSVPAPAPITVNVPESQVVIIPGPIVPPPPSVVVAAHTPKPVVHHKGKPCPVLDNDDLQKPKILKNNN